MCEDVCRLCCKSDVSLINVFNNNVDDEVGSKIHVCFGILISEDDKITKKICKQCFFLINSYSEHRQSAISNDARLKREYEEKTKKEDEEKKEDLKEKAKEPTILENLLVNPLIDTITPLPPDKPVDMSQDNFMSSLKLRNAHIKQSPKVTRKRLRYHPTVSKIKMMYPCINLPQKCYQWNLSPRVKLSNAIVNKWQEQKGIVWTVTNQKNKKPGIYLKRIMDKPENGETPNPEIASDDSFCMSNTSESDSDVVKEDATFESPRIILTRLGMKRGSDTESIPEKPVKRTRQRTKPVCYKEDLIEDAQEEKNKLQFLASLIEHDTCLNESNNEALDDNNLLVQTSHVSKTFICQTCNQVFDTNRSLKDHQKQHLKNALRCFKCAKSFSIVEDLVQHNLEMHATSSVEDERMRLDNLVNKSNSDNSVSDSTQKSTTTEIVEPDTTVVSRPLARKSTCQAKSNTTPPSVTNTQSDTAPPSVTNTQSDTADTSSDDVLIIQDKIEEYIISSDDDEVVVVEKETDKTNKPKGNKYTRNKIKTSPAVKSTERAKSKDMPGLRNVNITPRNKTDLLQHIPVKSFEEVSKENKVTAVSLSDEEFYLKCVFNKHIKARKDTTQNMKQVKKFNSNKIWLLKGVDKLLEKSFIPVEYSVSEGLKEGLELKYSLSSNKKMKPKSTSYRWCALSAIDIPKKDVSKSRPYPNSVLTQTGQIYDISKNMEFVSVSSKPNETTNTHSLIMKPNTNHEPQYILPNQYIGDAGNNTPQEPSPEPIQSKTSDKCIPLQNGKVPQLEQFIAKVLPNGVLELTPTIQFAQPLMQTSLPTNNPKPGNVVMPLQVQPPNTSKPGNIVMPMMHKTINTTVMKDLGIVSVNNRENTSTVNQNESPTLNLMYQQFGQQTSVNIQNFLSINVPISTATTSSPRPILPAPSVVQSSSNETVPTTSQAITPSPVQTSGQKPLLRIKNLSELTEKTNTNNNLSDRFTLQNMYVQTLSNYVNSCSNSPLSTGQGTSEEYLQIS